jgi:hypothetical protein
VRKLSAKVREEQVRPFVLPEPVREVGFLHAREHLRRAVGAELFHILREGIPSAMRGRDPENIEIVPLSAALPAPRAASRAL